MIRFVNIALLLFMFLPLTAEEGELFVFYPGAEVTITEKQDLRKRTNGKYEGFVYREMRCFLKETDRSSVTADYSGHVYVFEETRRNTRLIARKLEDSYPLSIGFRPDGGYLLEPDRPYPSLRGVPSFPDKPLAQGDRWQAFGERMLFAGGERPPSRAQILTEYVYQGQRGTGESAYYLINGQYAVRYRGDDPDGDPAVERTDGSHKLEIRIPMANEGDIFMRDTVEEQYTMRDGTRITYSGIILTWFDTPSGTVRAGMKDRIASLLSSAEEEKAGAPDIEISESPEGLLLTLPDLHFVPDKTDILPDEKGRLDTIAGMLKEIPDATFLVRGHTADVGTRESQLLLSEERASSVIAQLTARGLSADRFLYEGKGGTVPLGDNATEEGRKKNRRVEILILY